MIDGLASYRPTTRRPWDAAAAAHLLRRAGFAPTAEEIVAAVERGPAATVDDLVDRVDDGPRHDELDHLGDRLAARDDIAALRGWWLLRMRHSTRTLASRMAVFWHDHFATSNVKVGNPRLMYGQLRVFERHALGPLTPLVEAVSRDPAMIIWLDGDMNVKGRPNENYARELFELFTLGVGNYSETDIREAARAFTGWHQRGGRFSFSRRDHDAGSKSVLGVRGPHDGDDVIALALARPAAARFLAGKLVREFVGPVAPDDTLVDAVAARLRETGMHVGETLRTLLGSAAMFDRRWHRARIKSPVELVVGMARSLDLRVQASALADATSQMGQRLFEPPTVEGWEGHRGWINSATMLVRLNTVTRAVASDRFDAAAWVGRHGLRDRDAVVRFCTRLTLDDASPPALRTRLDAIDGAPAAVARETLRLLMSSPEYQLA